ncbi:MAG TPA: DinB family protein [Terriglobia bacterium]|nr:DinB family protein [Terriglobia bacterium]
MRDDGKALREHVLYLLRGGGAHLNFVDTISDFPANLRGVRPAKLPYTAWRLLEHMRIAQWDILDFCRNPKYASLDFPSGYWPRGDSPPNSKAWAKSVSDFRSDLKQFQRLVANPRTDLFAAIPHGDGQTILREALLVADHNAYHLGQLVILRRLLGTWKDK